MNNIDLNNRIAVVTGASQGFGYAIAKRFTESGAKVINIDNIPLSYARKNLCNATQIILKAGLAILGITAPEKM